MRQLLIGWPLRMARRAGHALRNATTRFATSADRGSNTGRADDGGADSEGDEFALAKQKSEYLKRFASEIDGITFFPALVPTALAGQTRLATLVLPVELMHTPFAAKSGLMRRS
jgi:hypothetical protein